MVRALPNYLRKHKKQSWTWQIEEALVDHIDDSGNDNSNINKDEEVNGYVDSDDDGFGGDGSDDDDAEDNVG